jgi:hypothetical protein
MFGRASRNGFSHTLQADDEDPLLILDAFAEGLSQLKISQSKLRLVLAGSLARYALTMPVKTLLSVEEETALARQTFMQRYSEAS